MQGLWNLIGKVQGPGKDFQYDILDVIPGLEGKSVWSLHNGKKRVRGSFCDASHSSALPVTMYFAISVTKN